MSYASPTADLEVTFDAGVLTLAFNRPADDNRLRYDMLEAIRAICLQAVDDVELRALVLRGNGGLFSAGDAWPEMGAWPERLSHRKPGGSHGPAPIPEQDAISALRNLPKPTIALLEGTCQGLALDLAAVCDLRVARSDIGVGDNRILQARAAATGITYVLPRLIGQSQATLLLLTGEVLDAAEALRIGLLHRVVEAAEFDTVAQEMVAQIARLPTRSWEVHKKQVLPQLDLSFDAAMTHCLGIRQTHVIEDIAEGREAFRERRDPEFTGR